MHPARPATFADYAGDTVRLPMVPATEKAQAAVRQAMVHAGLIN